MKKIIVCILSAVIIVCNIAFLVVPAIAAGGGEATAVNFKGKMKNKSTDRTADIDLYFDTDWFFDSPKEYNPRLSTLSCVTSLLAYEDNNNTFHVDTKNDKKDKADYKNLFSFFSDLDFKQVRFFDENQKYYIAYRDIEKNGETKKLVAIVARGTDKDDLMEIVTDANVFTKNDNHKGFEDAALAIMNDLDKFLKDYRIDKSKAVFWVTGHSRGGAAANIISGKMKKDNLTCFAYTFASPNLTNLEKAESDAFNIINTDDWVTTSTNNFFKKRYGKDKKLSCNDELFSKKTNALITDNITSDIPYDPGDKSILGHHNLFFYYAETIYYENKTVIIRPREVRKTFGEEDPELLYDIECRGKIAGDFFSGSLVREDGENVGEYKVSKGNLAYSTGGYDSSYSLIVKNTGKLIIEKAPAPQVAPTEVSYFFDKGSEGEIAFDFGKFVPADAGDYSCKLDVEGDEIFEGLPRYIEKEMLYSIAPEDVFRAQSSQITITVSTQNYEDIVISYSVEIVDEPHEETTEKAEETEKEPENENENKKQSGALPIVLGSLGGVALLGGGGAAYWFGFRKKR